MRSALRHWLAALSLDHPLQTLGFWLTVALFSASWWLTPLPPAVDYPQHLAVAAQLNRLLNPGAPEWQSLRPALVTYNGTFHVLAAMLGLVLPVGVAGKLVLSGLAPLLAGSALQLMRQGKRPGWYAAFLLPFSYGHLVGWGFINYAIGASLALLLVTWWLRWRDGDRRLLPWLIGLGLVLAYTHVLATLCGCLSIAVAYLASGRSPRSLGLVGWLRDALEHSGPLLPAGAYAVIVFRVHTSAPNIFWVPEHDGTGPQAHVKVWQFASYAVSNLGDRSDVWLFLVALGLLALLWLSPFWLAPAGPGAPRELRVLVLFWLLMYLVVPQQLLSTGFIFERFPIWIVAFAAAAAPSPPEPWRRALAPLALTLPLLHAVSVSRAFLAIPGARDASAIIDAIPEGSRLVAVMHDRDASPVIDRPIEVHLPAYFLVRKRGQLAFTFLRYASIPLRYRQGSSPPLYPGGIEWNPSYYRLHTRYGHHFDTVLVKTPDAAPETDPRRLTFGPDAGRVQLLAQRGRYWLYDVSPAIGR